MSTRTRTLYYKVPRRLRDPRWITFGIIGAFLLLFEWAAKSGYASQTFLSAPTVVFHSMLQLLADPEVQGQITTTSWRIFIAFVTIAVISSVLTFAFWRWTTLREAYLPILGGLFGTPIILTYLVFVALFGRGTTALVLVSIPMGTIPIVLNATDSLLNVEKTFIEVSRIYNASRWQMLRKVMLPAAAPGIFAGVRVGFTYTVISIIAAEFLLVMTDGLGGMISNRYFKFQTANMFVGIILIMLLVMFAIWVLRQIEEGVQR